LINQEEEAKEEK